MSIKLELPKLTDLKPRITVIGVGGAGGNAINNMIASGLEGVEFVVANTDAQALVTSSAEHRIQLGVNLTEGLGAGSKPEIGEAAAEEAIDEIRAQVSGSHMVFVACGMGGGTGTGATAVIARIAKEMGILTVGVVTKPFQFEGTRRMRMAEAGLEELKKYVDTLIVIPNQNLFRVASEKTTFAEAFIMADQVLYSGIACIVDLIVKEGLINLDFADVRTVMSGMGSAMMGTGEGEGERRAVIAAEEAIANPLLDDLTLRGAKGLLLSIIGGNDLTLYEVDEAASRVREEVDPEANIIVGASFDESLGDRVRVSIVASGMQRQGISASASQPSAARTSPPPPLPETSSVAPPPSGRPEAAKADDPGNPPRAWQAPGQVMIEEVAPQLPSAAAAKTEWEAKPQGQGDIQASPRGGDGHAKSSAFAAETPAGADFKPAPPERGPAGQRRMPTVDDFPSIGQRDYHAKSEQFTPQPQPHSQPQGRQPQPLRQPAPPQAPPSARKPEPARKIGFFERLTGRRAAPEVPKASATDLHPSSSYQQGESSSRNPGADGGKRGYGAPGGHGRGGGALNIDDGGEDVELPVFFNRNKR